MWIGSIGAGGCNMTIFFTVKAVPRVRLGGYLRRLAGSDLSWGVLGFCCWSSGQELRHLLLKFLELTFFSFSSSLGVDSEQL